MVLQRVSNWVHFPRIKLKSPQDSPRKEAVTPVPVSQMKTLSISSNNCWRYIFLCGTRSYLCLSANWVETYTLVYLAPKINIAPNNQSLTVPLKKLRRGGGALCLFSLKIRCFYVNQSDIVRNAAQKLKDRTYRICQQLSKSWGSWSKI